MTRAVRFLSTGSNGKEIKARILKTHPLLRGQMPHTFLNACSSTAGKDVVASFRQCKFGKLFGNFKKNKKQKSHC